MKLMFLCYEHPSPSVAGSLTVLHSLKYLHEKYRHDITLVANKVSGKEYPDLGRYCRVERIEIPRWPGLASPKAVLSAAAKNISSLFSRYPACLNYVYSQKWDRRIKGMLADGYDVLAIDHPAMLRYAMHKNTPVVLLEAFAWGEITRLEFELERNLLRKMVRLFYHYQTRDYGNYYERIIDVAIALSSHQRDMVKEHCPQLDIEVIPAGIDTEYFRKVSDETPFPSLMISGQMSGVGSVAGVLHFYGKVYPLVRAKVPELKLYIVGRNPHPQILRLSDIDKSVVVTGYVSDLRPYLSSAWVVVAPLIEGFGSKTRVREAMAVGRPVVATSFATTGIDVAPGVNIVIADEPQQMADRILQLLRDRDIRERMSARARLLMETRHSFEKLADRLNEVLERAAEARSSR